ncbi:unnamed protein product [Meloidogyne enterolobii]|uniref:Calponin-homology (CH) domain-containing protein n=2 Tax=Meloidogyne enterolobii TaxID=390850 RepID=A0A6V7WXL1_MELEN|nr:unnamed protein product [Meloidogyne enterolobii]
MQKKNPTSRNKSKKENNSKHSLQEENSSLEETTENKKPKSKLKQRLQGLKQRFIRRCCCCHCYPKMIQTGKSSDEECGEAEQRMQRNTFTRWVNHHLEAHSSSSQTQNLIEDMKDGILLCHLLEVLTGDVLPVTTSSGGNEESSNNVVVNKSSSSNLKTIKTLKRVYKLNNLNTALKCLRAKGIKLINNNVVDLADGNPRIWLGLIWQLILHFQVETGLSMVRRSAWHQIHSNQQPNGGEGTSTGITTTDYNHQHPSTSKLPPKKSVEQSLLDWLNREAIRPRQLGLPSGAIVDLDLSWKDGRLLLALLHRFVPALVNREEIMEGGDEPEEARQRAQKAIQLARLHLGISPFLDPTELCAPGRLPCRRSVITYISQFLCLYRPPQFNKNVKLEETLTVKNSQKLTTKNENKQQILKCYKNLFEWLRRTVEEGGHLKLSERQRPTVGQFKLFRRLIKKEEWLERRRVLTENVFPALKEVVEKEDLDIFKGQLDNIESIVSSWESKIQFLLSKLGEEMKELEQWMLEGERLLASSLPLTEDKLLQIEDKGLEEVLENLEFTIRRFEEHFKELPNKRLQLALKLEQHKNQQTSSLTTSPEDFLLLPEHLLQDLKERIEFQTLLERRIFKEILFIQSRLRIIKASSKLKASLAVWGMRTGSLKETKETLEEYKIMASECKPILQMEHLLNALKIAKDDCISSGEAHHENILESTSLLNSSQKELITKQIEKQIKEELGQFIRCEFILIDLIQLWNEFEEEKNLFINLFIIEEEEENLKEKEEVIIRKMEVLAEEMDETGSEWIKNAGEPVRRQIVELCDQLITARTTKIILQEEELKKCLFNEERKQQILNGNNKMKEDEQNNLSQITLNERKWLNNLEAFGKWLDIVRRMEKIFLKRFVDRLRI